MAPLSPRPYHQIERLTSLAPSAYATRFCMLYDVCKYGYTWRDTWMRIDTDRKYGTCLRR